MLISRRLLLGSFAALPFASSVAAAPRRDTIIRAAHEALERHGASAAVRHLVGVADFSRASTEKRFHVVDLAAGRIDSLLVAHGRGSDPAHRGWVERFSNEPGSAASSAGVYITAQEYEGRHGRSMRMKGLDPTNSNAEARAIVIHGAWYVSPKMIVQHGKLGRSEGCLAFCEGELADVLSRLGPGTLITAAKL